MLNYNKCNKCDEIKIDDLCDFLLFVNGDELPICSDCIENMIENKEIIVDDGKYSFTKKGMEIIIKETEKEIKILEKYKLRYLNDIALLNKGGLKMPDDKNDINFLPKNIKETEVKKSSSGEKYKEKNVNDNDEIDKIEEEPEKGSEGL